MIIEHHEREAYILRRRLELLEILNETIMACVRNGTPIEVDEDEIDHITTQFEDVLNPSDVCDSIKKIYPPRLFSERKARFQRR